MNICHFNSFLTLCKWNEYLNDNRLKLCLHILYGEGVKNRKKSQNSEKTRGSRIHGFGDPEFMDLGIQNSWIWGSRIHGYSIKSAYVLKKNISITPWTYTVKKKESWTPNLKCNYKTPFLQIFKTHYLDTFFKLLFKKLNVA